MASIPTSLVTLDLHARIPYTVQFGAGVEHQLTAESSLAINYGGSRGMGLFRSDLAKSCDNMGGITWFPANSYVPDAV